MVIPSLLHPPYSGPDRSCRKQCATNDIQRDRSAIHCHPAIVQFCIKRTVSANDLPLCRQRSAADNQSR